MRSTSAVIDDANPPQAREVALRLFLFFFACTGPAARP